MKFKVGDMVVMDDYHGFVVFGHLDEVMVVLDTIKKGTKNNVLKEMIKEKFGSYEFFDRHYKNLEVTKCDLIFVKVLSSGKRSLIPDGILCTASEKNKLGMMLRYGIEVE